MADPMRQRNGVGSSYRSRWMKVRTPDDALALCPGLQVVRVCTLQKGFRRHLVVSPMAHSREVRLRHAHHALLDSNPSTETVASVANRRGFTNLGRLVQRTQPATANRP